MDGGTAKTEGVVAEASTFPSSWLFCFASSFDVASVDVASGAALVGVPKADTPLCAKAANPPLVVLLLWEPNGD